MRPDASENSQIRPSTIVRAARAAGSHPHLASVLLQGRKSRIFTPVRESSGESRLSMQMPIGWRQRISLKSWPTALWWLWAPLALNVVSIFVLCRGAFRANASYLFWGSDGRFEVSIISQAPLFTYPTLGFTNDFIHGLGNIWFPINPWLIPAYVLSLTAP